MTDNQSVADLLGYEPRLEVGCRVSNEAEGDLLKFGFVAHVDRDGRCLLVPSPNRHNNAWQVRHYVATPDELTLIEDAGAVTSPRWVAANNLLLAAYDLPRTDVRRWCDWVSWALTLRRVG